MQVSVVAETSGLPQPESESRVPAGLMLQRNKALTRRASRTPNLRLSWTLFTHGSYVAMQYSRPGHGGRRQKKRSSRRGEAGCFAGEPARGDHRFGELY